jgi:hypothetical protein
MDISRISKAIAEVRRDQKFQDAEDVRNKDIDLLLPAELSDAVRRMAQTATALILRCFKGKLRIHSPNSDAALVSLLETEARKVGKPTRLDFRSNDVGPWRLALGCGADHTISADASGWTARINGVFNDRKTASPPAITFAVACAIAKLFNQAIFGIDKHAFEAWDFCLLRFSSGENIAIEAEQIDLGRIGLLGAGGIGSAVGYVLSISDWSGELDIIDFDTFQGPNLETCISADVRDVYRPLRKALALTGTFQGHKIVATERRCEVKAGELILNERWDAFICGVDNPETRLVLDGVNSGILLNAGLGATKQDVGWVLWTQHEKGGRALSSMYEKNLEEKLTDFGDVPEEFRDECGRKSYQGVSLALPFIGLAAGSLLAASLYQNAAGKRTHFMFMQMDLFAKQQRMTIQ